MATTGTLTRVVAIGDPGPTQQQITTALSAQDEFQLVDVLGSTERLIREVRAAEPDIILVDSTLEGQPTLDIIDDLALQFPKTSIVAVLQGEDPLKAQQVMLAGARAFLVQPFTQLNLLSTLRRIRDLDLRMRQAMPGGPAKAPEMSRPLRLLAVFSPKGGTGSSTVALNLALSMLEETEQQVLLLEGKMFFGDLGVMLNMRTQNTIADLVPHAASLDDALIRDVISEHASGLHVLLAPSNVQIAQGIRPDDLYNILVGVQRLYNLIVVDAGNVLNENTVTFLDAADRILVVSNPDLASLHDISRFIQVSRTLAYPAEKVLVAVNRTGMPGGVKVTDIESSLHHPIFGQVPDDGPKPLLSINRGVPLTIRYPRSPASQAIRLLAKSLVEIKTAAPVAEVTEVDKDQREALLRSSQLG
jgi:pilus assembly protein CpaE